MRDAPAGGRPSPPRRSVAKLGTCTIFPVSYTHLDVYKRQGKNIVRMRKHAMWYLAGLPGAAAARAKINACVSVEDFDRVFDELLAFLGGHEQEG